LNRFASPNGNFRLNYRLKAVAIPLEFQYTPLGLENPRPYLGVTPAVKTIAAALDTRPSDIDSPHYVTHPTTGERVFLSPEETAAKLRYREAYDVKLWSLQLAFDEQMVGATVVQGHGHEGDEYLSTNASGWPPARLTLPAGFRDNHGRVADTGRTYKPAYNPRYTEYLRSRGLMG
jgi:hypothetical protein